jgi:hypothetical protein
MQQITYDNNNIQYGRCRTTDPWRLVDIWLLSVQASSVIVVIVSPEMLGKMLRR